MSVKAPFWASYCLNVASMLGFRLKSLRMRCISTSKSSVAAWAIAVIAINRNMKARRNRLVVLILINIIVFSKLSYAL